MVDGYGMHLEARKDIARQGDGDGRISPMWTDLTMWAVLAGQHELAIELWSKVRVRDRVRIRDRVRVRIRAPNPNPSLSLSLT